MNRSSTYVQDTSNSLSKIPKKIDYLNRVNVRTKNSTIKLQDYTIKTHKYSIKKQYVVNSLHYIILGDCMIRSW